MRVEKPRGGACIAAMLALAWVVGVVCVQYAPLWRTFIGTDLGVYWEVARRLAIDGRLALDGNYWDHKPPMVYLLLAPFAVLDTPGRELLGLKVGTLTIYVGHAILACWAIARAGGRGASAWIVATAMVGLVMALVLHARLDAALNGILLVCASLTEAAGVALLIAAIVARAQDDEGQTRADALRAAVCAGVLLAIAPCWRPSAIAGGAVLGMVTLATLAVPTLRAWRGVALAACAGGLAAGLGIVGVWLALGTRPAGLMDVMLRLNGAMGAFYREQSPVVGYFVQRPRVLWTAVAGLVALACAAWVLVRAWRDGRNAASATGGTLAAVVMVGAYIAISLGLCVLMRKVIAFYTFQFLIPVVLGVAMVGGVALRAGARRSPLAGLLGVLAAVATTATAGLMIDSARGVPWSSLAGASIGSNRTHATGTLANLMADDARSRAVNAPTLLVLGNRAALYAQARAVGVRHFDATTYSLRLFHNPDTWFDAWLANMASPAGPTYVVTLNNFSTPGWDLRESVQGRKARIEGALADHYEVLARVDTADGEWPYRYNFVLLARRDRTRPREGAMQLSSP